MILKAQNLSRHFGDETVLKDISLSVESGQSLALWGSSGSGKSTLLALLGLILAPSSGTVLVDEQDTSTLDDRRLAALRRTQFGYIFQHTQLVGSLRALDNVLLPVRLSSAAERRSLTERFGDPHDRAREFLVELGLEHRLYHYPHQLSVGQKRRIALARALICDAPIILADEPTNDLDAASAQTVTNMLLKAATEHNKIVVIATHDAALADQVNASLVI
jgi:putative ABC transport system ATP-binding protein